VVVGGQYVVCCAVFIMLSSLLVSAQRMSLALVLIATVFYCYMSVRSVTGHLLCGNVSECTVGYRKVNKVKARFIYIALQAPYTALCITNTARI